MQNHNAQKWIHASFWYEKEVIGLFLSAKSVVEYFSCKYDQMIFFILLFFFLLHINVIYLGYFSKMKKIMNVNRRIILVSKFVMIKSMIIVNCAPFCDLITDPDLCERCYLHGFYIHTCTCDKTWKKGTYDLLSKNPYFFVTTWPNQMGSSLNSRKIVLVS